MSAPGGKKEGEKDLSFPGKRRGDWHFVAAQKDTKMLRRRKNQPSYQFEKGKRKKGGTFRRVKKKWKCLLVMGDA